MNNSKHVSVCEIQAKYKTSERKRAAIDSVKILSSKDAADYGNSIWENLNGHKNHVESFVILHLDRTNKVIGWSLISQGGVSGTVADPKVVFQLALGSNASALIIMHNHPSGNLKPSQSDRNLTDKMVNAGKVLDIQVLDHIILAGDDYFSFADNGDI